MATDIKFYVVPGMLVVRTVFYISVRVGTVNLASRGTVRPTFLIIAT